MWPDLKGWTDEGTLGRLKAQWQTGLVVVMAAGLDLLFKLAAIYYCTLRATDKFSVPSSGFRVKEKEKSPI